MFQEYNEAIFAHVIACHPNEACGVITEDGFIPLQNVSPEPAEAFDCQAQVESLIAEGKTIRAIVHSHVYPPDDPPHFEGPSEMDMRQQEAWGVPWGLCFTDGNNVSEPFYWGDDIPIPPFEGRQFRHGPSGSDNRGDCYALIRDWYQVNLNIKLPPGYRDDQWWSQGKDLYRDNFKMAGFYQVELDDIRVGDVVLAHVMSGTTNHGGIYIGNSLVLHHLSRRLSRTEPILRWQHLITMVLRHKDAPEP